MSVGMFLGTYLPRLDDKGRLILPAKFRDRLSDGFVITKGHERCLYIYPEEEFVRIAADVQRGPTSAKGVRDYARVFLADASDEVLDRQGRVTIPPGLRAYAGLTRDVAVVGTGNKVEVWDAEAWARYREAAEASYADQAEEVYPGVF